MVIIARALGHLIVFPRLRPNPRPWTKYQPLPCIVCRAPRDKSLSGFRIHLRDYFETVLYEQFCSDECRTIRCATLLIGGYTRTRTSPYRDDYLEPK